MKPAILFTTAVGLALLYGAASAQSAKPAAAPTYDHSKPYPAYTAPRTGDGHPDLQGMWSNVTLTGQTRPAAVRDRLSYTEDEVKKLEQARVDLVEASNVPTPEKANAEYRAPGTANAGDTAAGGGAGTYNDFWKDPGNAVMRVNGQPRTSIITTSNGSAPPAKSGAAQAQAQAQVADQPGFLKLIGDSPVPRGTSFDGPESRGNGERCIIGFGRGSGPPMFANGWYNNNYQIVQSPNAVSITVEMNHDARVIRLNSKHRTDDVRPYFGDSIGWYEGDTLVVETKNIPQTQSYMGSWKNLTVTEKFKRVAADRLLYQFTISDPTFWDAAWGGEYEFHPQDGGMFEYACHEGNYAMHGILSGARVQEAAAAEAAAKAKGGKSVKKTSASASATSAPTKK